MKSGKVLQSQSFNFIEFFILISIVSWESFLNAINFSGLAWWAEVETQYPSVIYLFGPFFSRGELKKNLNIFITDLSNEGSKPTKKTIFKGSCKEPLTMKKVSLNL